MLPVFFQNIPYYKIDDLFTFSGDLIITSGIIYYFPHNTSLEPCAGSTLLMRALSAVAG